MPKYKVELQTSNNAPIEGRMRAIIDANNSDDAIREARKTSGMFYQEKAWVQACTDEEVADMDGTLREWLRT